VLDSDSDETDDETDEEAEDPEAIKRQEVLKKYRMEQQQLMQLRSTILSEALAKRGVPMITLLDVSTPDGQKPPEKVDWDCALSTQDEPKTCLYSFDAEPNTKVIAPFATTQWISLSALNRLRRTDPTKVEPMWHSQYAVLKSWFGDDSQFTILQHCGPKGLILNLLLEQSIVLKSLLTSVILLAFVIFLPVIDFWVNRIVVSSTVWMNWSSWARIMHAALPLKLLLGQMSWKMMAKAFGKIEQRVRDTLVELECANFEEMIPVTVGPGSEYIEEEEDDLDIFLDDDDVEDDEELLLDNDDDDSDVEEDDSDFSDDDFSDDY